MRIGYARVSTDIAARRLFGLAADSAVAIRINVVPEPMFSVCSQIMWFHSHLMWFWEGSYSQSMWFGNHGCYRSEPFMFSVRYT